MCILNTSRAMVTQECTDKKLEAKLRALEVVLLHPGDSTNINTHMYIHKWTHVHTHKYMPAHTLKYTHIHT